MLACILASVTAFEVLFSLEIGLSEGGEGGGTGCVCICLGWSLNFPSVAFGVPVEHPVGYMDLEHQERGWIINQLLLILSCESAVILWLLQ